MHCKHGACNEQERDEQDYREYQRRHDRIMPIRPIMCNPTMTPPFAQTAT